MYLTKTPGIIKPLASDFVWSIRCERDELFLTFDDGPEPGVTDEILDILEGYNAKASFFCVGSNVLRYPELFQRIREEGHSVGNHTFSHENGWESSLLSYLRSARRCQELVESTLFRPPYGRIRRNQSAALKRNNHLIMWDVLSADFDPNVSPEQCYRNVIRNSKKGSIVVFHDSQKSRERVLFALPRVLKYFTHKGYTFSAITPDRLPPLSV